MLRRFLMAVLGDRAGVVAIEAAFALPILCMMVFGMYETAQAVICYYKLIDAANSIADLISQTTAASAGVGNTDFDNFYVAGQLIMSPNVGAGLKLDIASVNFSSKGKASIGWHVQRGGASATSNASLKAATSTLVVNKGSVVVVQASYSYTSALNYFITSPISMTFQAFAIPRNVLQLDCPPTGSGESCS